MVAAIIKGLTLGILLGISVGPVIFSIIKQSINNGHKGGYIFISGVAASDIAVILIANLFTSLFQSIMDHEKVIGISGSIFLVALGVYYFFFKKAEVSDEGRSLVKTFRKRDMAGIFASGFLMNALNPGALVFWLAASATIMADSKTEQFPNRYRFIVFATCILFNIGADILKVLLANKIRPKLTVHNIHIINRISGLIFIGFGIALAWGIINYVDKMH
ncbi:LysE family translocator [Foetidibacter luteolus]|uniref:LysE family translocator n=1 Tax=Foetidibacter luteolus TaxID=2608880 RepID=UPI00129AA6B8|nr:LysE family transporter [Foetidibacter luteolus]